MLTLTTSEITKATINASRSEAAAITFPRDFADVPWPELDFYGWRDSRMPRRGYLVTTHHGDPTTVLLTTQASGSSTRRKAMCAICRAVDNDVNIALFAARRAGPAGRKGDTVGTYICAGLDCSAQLRRPTNRAGRTRLADGYDTDDERAAAMLERLSGFLVSIR